MFGVVLGLCACRCCTFTDFTDSLNFQHFVFALAITSKGMTPECVKCNTDHHEGLIDQQSGRSSLRGAEV